MPVVFEFVRYAIVGGVAFLVDFCTMVCCQEFVCYRIESGVYVSVFFGFLAGLSVNYLLSLRFVFTQAKDRGKGRSFGAFALFGLVGVAGLGLTEFGMWIGVSVLGWSYLVVKVCVTAVVLLWNYLGRKLTVFK